MSASYSSSERDARDTVDRAAVPPGTRPAEEAYADLFDELVGEIGSLIDDDLIADLIAEAAHETSADGAPVPESAPESAPEALLSTAAPEPTELAAPTASAMPEPLDDEAAPDSPTPEAPPTEAPEGSPVGQVMRDEVVMALMAQGQATLQQAFKALQHQTEGLPLWRCLLHVPEIDRASVWAEVARRQQVARIALTSDEPKTPFLETIRDLCGPDAMAALLACEVVPVRLAPVPGTQRSRLVLATHDPTHPDVQTLVEELDVEAEVRFLEEADVHPRLERIRDELGLADAPAADPPSVEDHDDDALADPLAWSDLDAERPEDAAADWGSSAPLAPDDAPPDAFSGGDDAFELPGMPAEAGLEADAFDEHAGAPGDPSAWPWPSLDDGADEDWPFDLGGDGHGDGQGDGQVAPLEPPEAAPRETKAAPSAPGRPTMRRRTVATPEDPDAGAAVEPTVPDAVKPAPVEAGQGGASRDRVVSALLRKQIVTAEQVHAAEKRQDDPREALWRVLTEVAGVDREAIFAEAAGVYAFPEAVLSDDRPDVEFVRLVTETLAQDRRDELIQLRVLPFEYEIDMDLRTGGPKLIFITHDPARSEVHRLLQDLKFGRFELRYAPESVLNRVIGEAFPRKNEYLERMTEDPVAFDLGTSYQQNQDELLDEDALEAEISRSTLINLFEATLVEAVRRGASDIHIFPNAKRKVEIHLRVDGRLKRWHVEDKIHPEAFLAVAKDNAMNVDRFERDRAQDGFIQRWIDDALIRFRVSVLPIASAAQEVRAESIVIRVLDDRKVITDLRQLGLLDTALERFDRAIRQPHGMVILTGPTGSGKSTTLVAALHQVVNPEVNVLTVEDPVEYIIPDVRQVKLSHKLDLEGALRSILRHDPDIVMVGEMRDRPTAELAIKLANTGHLTFSTLHTNDAPSAVSRLYKMGIEPFLLAYAINLIVAQRLIRRLCPNCKVADADPDPVLLRELGFTAAEMEATTFFTTGHDAHCKTCGGTGYKGRRAISETLYFSRAIRHRIVEAGESIDEDAIRQLAQKEGMLTLRDSAREVVKMGDTSVEEMLRVTATEG